MSKTKKLFSVVEMKKAEKEIKQYLHCIYPSNELQEISEQGFLNEFIAVFQAARVWELSIKDCYEIAISEFNRDTSEDKRHFKNAAQFGLCPNF
ncbi:hypothetical protein [Aquitalea pelogenes]|uniref:hypothetical protein n=1 Tax=Aquitalea pelogenes TaxID=1293573 RepID=UPI0035B4EFFE